MENQCIYCDIANDLSKSDIIPDALTNAKIINPNVCRIEHNNKFSDLFEDEVIRKLALITNGLDIKSSKSKTYASYSTEINIDGTEYSTKISSETELFRNKKMRSVGGKYLFGPIEEIKKIKDANDKNITQIDVNQIVIEKKINIDLSVFFSQSMYRMMAKIAFEWYCLQNDISGKVEAFEPIIQFITNGIGDDLVTIVGNEELYSTLKVTTNFGSHTLLSYVAKDNSVNILVSLFGIAIYNIKICDSVIDECRNNVIFQELSIDAKRVQFKFYTFEHFIHDFHNKFTEVELGNGIKAKIPKDMTDVLIQYQLFYGTNFPLFQVDLQCANKPNEKIINLIIKNMEDTLQSSAVTLRGLKRFVKENFNSFDEEIKLNPKGTNKKAVFMFYLLFIVGQSNGAIKGLSDLNKVLKDKFSDEIIGISDEVICKLNDEIFSTADYSDIILKGAKTIYSWNYE
ncbi:hypothetical protein AB9M92_07485 [Peribacillus frigoritolerans]|uniref:hypothetical protein n=1 Tax=Peribacillus frigoritolerans TaxID=450367 RepID=UPI0035138711